jgi:hypothetical protein
LICSISEAGSAEAASTSAVELFASLAAELLASLDKAVFVAAAEYEGAVALELAAALLPPKSVAAEAHGAEAD